MKIKRNFSDPKVDFLLKSYFLMLLLPNILMWLSIFIFLSISNSQGYFSSVNEGFLVGGVFAFFIAFVSYLLGWVVAIVIILTTNNIWMSGRVLSTHPKYTRFWLFILALLLTLVTGLIFYYVDFVYMYPYWFLIYQFM